MFPESTEEKNLILTNQKEKKSVQKVANQDIPNPNLL